MPATALRARIDSLERRRWLRWRDTRRRLGLNAAPDPPGWALGWIEWIPEGEP